MLKLFMFSFDEDHQMLDQDVPLTSPSTSITLDMVVQIEKGEKEKLRRANRGLVLAWAACLALGRCGRGVGWHFLRHC